MFFNMASMYSTSIATISLCILISSFFRFFGKFFISKILNILVNFFYYFFWKVEVCKRIRRTIAMSFDLRLGLRLGERFSGKIHIVFCFGFLLENWDFLSFYHFTLPVLTKMDESLALGLFHIDQLSIKWLIVDYRKYFS